MKKILFVCIDCQNYFLRRWLVEIKDGYLLCRNCLFKRYKKKEHERTNK